jgi:hypothetical protein
MVNVNTLVFPRSDINAIYLFDINDRGEIAVQGILPNGDMHAVLLIPYGDCDDECEARIAANENSAAISAHPVHDAAWPRNARKQGRSAAYRLAGRYHVPGRAVAPSN